MDIQIPNIPNHEYIEMCFSAPTVKKSGKNEKEIFENLGNGQFSHTIATIGVTLGSRKPHVIYHPIEEWDDIISRRLMRGYTIIKTQKMEKKKITYNDAVNEYKPLEDSEVENFINWLRQGAQIAFEESYTIDIDDISDEMIQLGTNILKELIAGYKTMSVAAFNMKLRQLYQAIPRQIKRYSDELMKSTASEEDKYKKILSEQDLLDFMIQQVKASNAKAIVTDHRPTILEAFGFDEFRAVTPDEEAFIKFRMDEFSSNAKQYVRAWRVANHKTEERFNKYCQKYGTDVDSNIHHLFHGSDTKNWWSIATNGLYLDPDKIAGTGASVCGKAFGYGSYFAPSAQKSIGYTSSSGSYWRNGSDTKGYMAIFKVATGDKVNGIYDIYAENKGTPQHWSDLQRIKPGADCTWARGGAGYVRNDEVIVYREEQSTIEYLIEFSTARN